MNKGYAIAIIMFGANLYLAYSHDREMAKVRQELRIAQEALPAWVAEADRLMGKLAGCEQNRETIDELRSEATYRQIDLNECKKDLGIAMNYGVKCLKRHLSMVEKLRKCK